MMKITPAGLALIHGSEGCRLVAYDDNGNAAGGVWTLGWGTTRYPPWHLAGRRVRQGDICTREQADQFFAHDLKASEDGVDALTRDDLLPRQADGLVCLTYNIGVQGYAGSTVRRRVNAQPLDPTIREAFMRWHKDDGVDVEGLWVRRHRESDFYFGVQTPCPEPPFPHKHDYPRML
jgi:lysozyme